MTNSDDKREKVVRTLDGLIAILEDGKLGYKNAAEHAENSMIKSEFVEFARERSLFIVELQDEINKLGKSTDTSGGGALGAIHRAWIDIKSTFTSGDTESIINACITGEESAVEQYEDALKVVEMEPNQIAIVSKQLNSIKAILMKLKAKTVN